MHMRHRVSVLLALALAATGTHAAGKGEPVAGCVDLGASHSVTRYGSQFVLIADGDAHYRLDVDSGCDALGMATRLQVSTDGQAGRVCPQGTRVKTNSGRCEVIGMQRIDATAYARFTRAR